MSTLRNSLALALLVALSCKAPRHRTDQSEKPGDVPVGTAETHGSPTLVSAITDASAETPLEGRLSFQLVGKPAETFDYAVSGDKVRVGIAGTSAKGQGVEAIVEKGKDATIILRDQGTYERMPLAALTEPNGGDLGKNVKVDKTGKTSLVSGHSCEEWVLTDRDYQVHACVLRAGPAFDLQAVGARGGAFPPAWLDRVVDEGYVPLRVAIADPRGNPLPGAYGEWTSTRVDPLVFEPPKGFRER